MTVQHEYTPRDHYLRKIYDKQNKTFLGRNAQSWAKISIFYLVFYGVLAGLFAICMTAFFYARLDPRIPTWQLDRSAIGTNPGLGFRPMPTSNLESTLIWFQAANKSSYLSWVENLNGFLDNYYHPSKQDDVKIRTCSHSDMQPLAEREVCEVEVRDWGDCNKNNYFFYHKNSPCLFLKLNKIYGWTPEYYDDPNDLPDDMPQQLKNHIRSINDTRNLRNIWLSCEGENPADKEYLGPVTYYPERAQGFPGYYFPFTNAVGYLSPLVAVKFERPVPGIVINIECRAWAKNIIYSRYERTGSVHFELLID